MGYSHNKPVLINLCQLATTVGLYQCRGYTWGWCESRKPLHNALIFTLSSPFLVPVFLCSCSYYNVRKSPTNFYNSIKKLGAPHVSFHLCRDFLLDYVTLTFGLRRDGSAPKRELNQMNLCLNPKKADPPVVS